jgi:hypothetical protein
MRFAKQSKKEKLTKMTKSLLLIGTLALAGIASAKSYEITLAAPAKAGKVQMAAGQYEVKVVGNGFAVFTNVDSGKKFFTLVKVEDTGKKFEQTAVDSTNEGGAKRINAIELEGSSTVIELGE